MLHCDLESFTSVVTEPPLYREDVPRTFFVGLVIAENKNCAVYAKARCQTSWSPTLEAPLREIKSQRVERNQTSSLP